MGRPRKQTVTVQIELPVSSYQLLCIEAHKHNALTDDWVCTIVTHHLNKTVPEPVAAPLFAPPPAAPAAPPAPPPPAAAPEVPDRKRR